MSKKLQLIMELQEWNMEIEISIKKLQHDLKVNEKIIRILRIKENSSDEELSEKFSIELIPSRQPRWQRNQTNNTEEQVKSKRGNSRKAKNAV
jgi:hypothetical protein